MARIKLNEIPREQQHEYAGCWCEFGVDGLIGVYEGPFLGGRIKVPGEASPVYRDPAQITILADLQRAWSAEGVPMPKENAKCF